MRLYLSCQEKINSPSLHSHVLPVLFTYGFSFLVIMKDSMSQCMSMSLWLLQSSHPSFVLFPEVLAVGVVDLSVGIFMKGKWKKWREEKKSLSKEEDGTNTLRIF